MRAEGLMWWKRSPFAAHGAMTETEAMCSAEGKPIFRMLWGILDCKTYVVKAIQ